MNIVHICSSVKGGAGIAAFRLHRALIDAGVDSSVLTRTDSAVEDRVYKHNRSFFVKILERLRFPVGNDKFKNCYKRVRTEALTYPFALSDVSRDPLVQEADIIHLHWVGSMLNYEKFFRCIHKPILWTFHDMNPFMGIGHYEHDYEEIHRDAQTHCVDAYARYCKYRAYRMHSGALALACLSSSIMEKSKATDCFGKYEHFLVKNCIPTDEFCPRNKEEQRVCWGIPQQKKVFLFVSHAVEAKRKGFHLLMQAITELDEDCLCVCVGIPSGINHSRFLETGVVHGADKLSSLYACADALILPSLEDNLPNTMLEALSCGVPVIAFPIGGMKDVIQDGANGILAASPAASDLKAALARFLSGGVAWDAERISTEAKSFFSPEVVAGSYIEIYNHLLSSCSND